MEQINTINPLNMQPNSKKKVEKPRLEPVTSNVMVKKRPWYKRAAESFLIEDSTSIGSFIVRDVLVPTIKDLIYDTINGSLAMALYGSTKARSSRKPSSSGNGSIVSYGDFYTGGNRQPRKQQIYSGNRIDIDLLIFGMAEEAHEVKDALIHRLNCYQCATVQDLYDLVHTTAPATAIYWGWTDLSDLQVRKIPDGWLLDLPRPQPLN